MNFDRPVLTQHQLRRVALWLMAVLAWTALVFMGDRRPLARHRRRRSGYTLKQLSYWVSELMMAHALDMLPDIFPDAFPYWRRNFNGFVSHFRRTVLGARLRRVLDHRDPAACIANLITVLRNLDAYAAQLADRVRYGLTRFLSACLTISPAPTLVSPFRASPAFADSS